MDQHLLYIRLDLTIEGAGSVSHIAELKPLDPTQCELQRIIELDPQGVIQGAGSPDYAAGLASTPNKRVPHPDTFDTFPDIEAFDVTADEFLRLWEDAVTKFPELAN
ncbi:hypothetical protein N7326_07820 [Corynebacterium sp. ES2794-CONJ1]|uniref:hypothetical protein n=1 Tax=unclassified Corynebacterium TaxID=2624378 RepID=UPI002167C4CC|nr:MULTISPECIES: hypothetical protein [unclassified Corynebacterium]MCS4492251.1 hypothetical protein [Corynebacterium sp. ES2715-CONJ3]MCU9519770.1 hypothetical protein [Corynebacterium sp. ES2794-CONJ1]